MKTEKKKIEIRMTIEGELARRLTRIKQYYDYESYTDTLRFIITTKFEDLTRERPITPPIKKNGEKEETEKEEP